MNRREIFGVLGVGAAGLAISGGRAAGQSDHEHEAAHHHDKVHEDCLKACGDCAKSCDETFHHCMMELAAGKKEHARSARLLADCAGFCALSACNIARHSPLMAHSCGACAEACKDTVAEVQKFNSAEMKQAVKALQACEASCRAMVAAMGAHQHHAAGA